MLILTHCDGFNISKITDKEHEQTKDVLCITIVN